jgi:tyrosine-protein phosphatase SIW14
MGISAYMRVRFPISALAAAASFLLAVQTCVAQSVAAWPHGEKIQIAGVRNAGKISSVLFRGNQPQAPAFAELKKLGITTIVDLRAEDPDTIQWERKQAESLGLRFVHIPVGGWSSPTDEQVLQFLALFHGDSNQKVFVHCRFGEDRTGVFVATYRMAIDHWRAEQALKEMYFFGFHGYWHPAMKSFVRNFPARLSTTPAFAGYAVAAHIPAPATAN